jgi:alpha-galactosidase
VEIETCASGGGRVDFGILERTDRVWVSDSIDALDRHAIQDGFSVFFPPELMGSHVGATTAHTTMRTHRVGFRAVAGLFGSFGAEWNLLDATTDERSQLAEAIALHKRFGELLHSGDVLRVDHPDSTVSVHGMISSDRRESLLAVTRLRSGTTHHTAPLRVPDLDPDRSYELRLLETFGEPLGHARSNPTWTRSGITATGRHLGAAGVSLPVLYPESSRLIHLVAVD